MSSIRNVFKQEHHQNILSEMGYNLDADITEPNPFTGSFILHDAIAGKRPRIVQILLEQSSSKQMIDEFDQDEGTFRCGKTPLGLAIFYNQPLILKSLLEKKADSNKPAKNGITPLMLAAAMGKEKDMELLLTMGKARIDESNLDAEKYGKPMTALMYASQYGQLKSVEFLIKNGAKRTSPSGEEFIEFAYDKETREKMMAYLTSVSLEKEEKRESSKTSTFSTSLPFDQNKSKAVNDYKSSSAECLGILKQEEKLKPSKTTAACSSQESSIVTTQSKKAESLEKPLVSLAHSHGKIYRQKLPKIEKQDTASVSAILAVTSEKPPSPPRSPSPK